MRRKHFLTFSATALGGLVFTLDRRPMRVHAQSERKIRVPLQFFDLQEALMVSAAAAPDCRKGRVHVARRNCW
jgi:hypothetical protein